MRRGFIGLVFLTLPTLLLGADRPLIIAHRGASHTAPENTLAAFNLAWEENADGIEGDFYLTKDHQVVCIHDKDTKRTAGKKLTVANSTLADLRALDVGSWKAEKYAGEKIPTLAEVLKTVPAGKRIYVEIKCGPEIVPFLPAVFEASGLKAEQIRVIAFDPKVIAAVRAKLPNIKAYWLTSFKKNAITRKWKPSDAKVREVLTEISAHGVSTKAEPAVVDEDFVAELRKGGWEFHCWTVDKVATARKFWGLGVDSITTNRPAFLKRELFPTREERGR